MGGIIFHELCHLLMCILTNTSVERVTLLERTKLRDNKGMVYGHRYNGRVNIKEKRPITFLQALIIGLAPIFISFWVFFSLLEYVLSKPNIHGLYIILIIFVLISIVLSAAPSSADLRIIPTAFGNNLKYSFYQIFLLMISILSVWGLSLFLNTEYPHELVYYVVIALFYYGFKYGFRILKSQYQSLTSSNFNQLVGKNDKYKHKKQQKGGYMNEFLANNSRNQKSSRY